MYNNELERQCLIQIDWIYLFNLNENPGNYAHL